MVLSKHSRLAARINETMDKLIQDDQRLIGEVSLYNFSGGGKRLRPLMFCLATKALNAALTPAILKTSTSFEFLHMATLLHDDIVDQAETRRGQPAAHIKFGITETVLVGDYLMAKAADLGMSVKHNQVKSLKVMTQVVRQLSLGELLQLKNRHDLNLAEDTYFEIIYKKTAALIEGALHVAALAANAAPRQIQALGHYGRLIGLAFQIADDILDYQSDPEHFGKPVGQDLNEGKVTLPFILARKNLKPARRKRLFELAALQERTEAQHAEVAALIAEGRGVTEAVNRAKALVIEAIDHLNRLPKNQAREDLAKLAFYMVERDF